ncbi:MAG: hypothetical protein IKX57_04215 [Oscillospiraceae bacterium]|nr:hypothetical protein [Oscillospiraceae bacterium]
MRSEKLLTVTAIFCRSLAWFPVCILMLSLRAEQGEITLLTALFEEALTSVHSELQILLPSAAVCAVSFAVQLIAYQIGRRLRTSPRRAFALKAAAAIPAAALSVFAVFRLSGSLFNAVVLTAVVIFLPLRGLDHSPDTFFTQSHFAAFLTAVCLSALMLHYARLPVHSAWYLAVTAVVAVLYLLLRNQFMLIRLVNRRSNTETQVPQDIRRTNLILVLGLLLLAAAVFLFREQIGALLAWMRDTAAKAAYGLLALIAKTADKMAGKYKTDEEEMMEMPPLEGEFSPFWLLLWIPIILVAVIIWRNLLSDWFYVIRSMIGRLIAFLRGDLRNSAKNRHRSDSAEFHDTETILRRKLTARQEKRLWRQKLRAWKAMPDSREKFYAGYQLLVTAPAWETGELRDSDTVREIRGKWLAHHTPQDALDAVTAAYHTDRYAERGLPEHAIPELTAALEHLRKQRKGAEHV